MLPEEFSQIEYYRIRKDLPFRVIAQEMGISPAVYINTIKGRNRNGQPYRTRPNERTRFKIERWIEAHREELAA